MKKLAAATLLSVVTFIGSHAQLTTLCNQASPACAQTGLTFPNSTNVPSLGTINCLYTTPNPAWFFMQVGTSGNIDMTLNQTTNGGSGIDVDFMLWGPFNSVSAGCTAIGNSPSSNNADCSYSASATESVNIENGQTGQFYILLITNYSNQAGTITLVQSGGAGTTNCGVLSNAQNNGPICMGQNLQLQGTGTSGSGNVSYSWYLMPDFSTVLSNSQNFSYTPQAPGSYQFALITMDNLSFQADTAYTTATVNPIPAAPSFTSTSPACQGSAVSMTPTTIIPGASYHWSGTNGFVSNQTTVSFPNATPGLFNADYSLTVTVNGCTSPPFTQNLTVYPTNVPLVAGPTEACEGAYVSLDVTNGNLFQSFAWDGAPGSDPQQVLAGSHVVAATDANGCVTSSAPYVVSVISNPLDITGPSSYCEGSSITLSATPGKQSYAWSTGSTQETAVISTQDGPITVTVVSQTGCTRSDTVIIERYDKPAASFTPAQVCNDQPVTFQNTTQVGDAYGSAQAAWSWNFGHAGSITLPGTDTQQEPTHQFPGPGTYNVTLIVTTNHGCADTVMVPFTVVTPAKVDFVFEPLCFGQGKFVNKTIPGSNHVDSYVWTFGDNSASANTTDSLVYHVYPSVSTYTVSLTATDDEGCVSDTTMDITLKNTPMFDDIPNIITPNGDNVNDEYSFLPEVGDCYNYTFVVFNRWGAKVFETEGATNKSFNGKSILGSKLQDGVYYWVLRANGIGAGQGEEVLKKGSITIAGTK